MKKKLFTLIALTLLITGCDPIEVFGSSSKLESSSTTTSSEVSSSESHSSSEQSSSQGETSSAISSSESSESSSSSEDPIPVERYRTIDIYASNDIHGQIEEGSNECGVGKFATYFKEKGEQENTLLLDQGDTWQGSIYSNYNHGALITDVMNYIQFDARTVGNHDFDWGVDYVKANTARAYNGYTTPTLAGNVYDYDFDTKTTGTTQQADIGIKSVSYTLENGLKVGILGCIGYDQITSISSNYTHDITFTDHIDFIKDEATHLRNDEHCDVVICSIHTGQDSVTGYDLQNYVDLVLCGHTHYREYTSEGNLYYVQSNAYTRSFSHVTLTYDAAANDVTRTSIEFIYASQIKRDVTTIDAGVQSIMDTYNEEVEEAANTIVADNVVSAFTRYGYAENLMAKAIFERAKSEGYDVCLSYLNEARAGLPSSHWTYSDLYQSFPFDNKVYIATITGREFLDEIVNWNYIYRNPTFTSNEIDPNGLYKIAVIDFIYLHTDSSRRYNFFPETAGSSTTTLTKTYREILKDYLRTAGYSSGTALNPADFETSSWSHDRTVFRSI